MKLTGQSEKWAIGISGVVCLALLINLAQSSRPVRAGGNRASPSAGSSTRRDPGTHRGGEDSALDDPQLRLDLLKEIKSRPLLQFNRNPFEYEPLKVETPKDGPAPAPTPPPPPPPIPVKAMGFSEKPGGVREAYVTDDEQMYIVHQGESFGKHYRVLRIDAQMIEIEDETSHQKAQLPFPQ